jgi:hypothetical protein
VFENLNLEEEKRRFCGNLEVSFGSDTMRIFEKGSKKLHSIIFKDYIYNSVMCLARDS